MNAGSYTLTDPRYSTSPGYPPTKFITMLRIYLKNFQLSKAGDWYYHDREANLEVKSDANGDYIEVAKDKPAPLFYEVDSPMGKLITAAKKKAEKGK